MTSSSQKSESTGDTLPKAVWQTVSAIPAGRVASYGQVAAMAGYPGHARHVGRILSRLPAGSRLPWHRVLRSDGQLAFPLHSDAWQRQQQKLNQEGVHLSSTGRVPRAVFWRPDSQADRAD